MAMTTRTKLKQRDRASSFCEDLIFDEAGVVYPQLPIVVKVPPLLEFLQLGGSYDLVEHLWAQFSLTIS